MSLIWSLFGEKIFGMTVSLGGVIGTTGAVGGSTIGSAKT